MIFRFLLLLPILLLPLAAAASPPLKTVAAPQAIAPDTLPGNDWLLLTPEKRRAVLDAWLLLPQDTRPPFPTYRDSALEKPKKKKAEKSAQPKALTPAPGISPAQGKPTAKK